MAEEEVSSVVREKLMPGEEVVAQARTNISDLVATDKRILKFSSNGYEALDYSDISRIKYGSFTKRKITSRILIVFCALVLIGIAAAIWGAYFDETVRNVTLGAAVGVSIGCGIFALLSLTLVFSYDYGYYQVESGKIGKDMEKYWRVMRPMFSSSRVDKFFKTAAEKGGLKLDKKK
jgi:hypothetical protein